MIYDSQSTMAHNTTNILRDVCKHMIMCTDERGEDVWPSADLMRGLTSWHAPCLQNGELIGLRNRALH